ncbi:MULTISPECIES: hypothetical protein [Mammaliicoccus]|jgi:hypothetical protein|uniref:Uncharacterized protein n=1 Tax=Mammaliicoccus lentus TaxID=42858 RepID=A0AAP1WN03_MAMLE|nr:MULTISPECIES: hypothetical protein [Mammaliicoccus]HBV04793.1 hypothetical protein [Staphylococcus sp.]MBF0748235.1 hypothetical protein [Mammaliicoccus lentus]MBF0794122.1 hypothetical protein [Mammaliicoccus lentus]MBF0842806.1 hypothetical protein [Mammaliicoccus lentus]MBU6113145.1 hypothetical protein [Mammaliicoccus lentus]
MRQLLLVLFIILNTIMIVTSLNVDIEINFLSYRVILVAFSFLLSIVFILENANKSTLTLAILSALVALGHLSIIIQNVYLNVYSN